MPATPEELERLVAAAFEVFDAEECPRSRELAAWRAGALDRASADDVAVHVRTCLECRGDVAAFDASSGHWGEPGRLRRWLRDFSVRPLFVGGGLAVATCALLLLWMPLEIPAPAPEVTSQLELTVDESPSLTPPSGSRAVTMAIAGGEWVRGQRKVDVIFARDVVDTGERESITLLHDVIAYPAAGGDPSTGWVTLLLLVDEAEMLSLASTAGRVSLVMKPDAVDAEVRGATRTLADVTEEALKAASTKRRALSTNVPAAVSDLPEGLRGVPVRSGLVLLKENDWVDVVALLPDGASGELKARTLFFRVRVAGVASLDSRHETSALLELLPEEAELLALAKPGQVHLALRSPKEPNEEESLLLAYRADMRTLLTGERGPLLFEKRCCSANSTLLTGERSAVLRSKRAQTWQRLEVEIIKGSSRAVAPGSSPAGGERYIASPLGSYFETRQDRLSTFAADVDTGSFTVLRQRVRKGTLPPPDAVRVEEILNYFKWAYPAPERAPFAVHVDGAPSPFQKDRTLLRVALQGREVRETNRKPAHLVFLVDTSGSMQSPDKLPLAQASLRLLVDALQPNDTVALLTYAGSSTTVLPPTPAIRRTEILDAIHGLQAGGGTAMASGLLTAYRLARASVRPGEISRVIVLSDGDANIGGQSHQEMLALIKEGVDAGVTLTTVGFGTGNYKDDTMEQLANRGNGSYHYVDSLFEARRLFVEQLGGTLEVIAKDVKIQVTFDPATVKRYRLVGYENRDVADEDFRDDTVDGGEIGAGHRVTALYELELVPGAKAQSLATVHVRWKEPDGVKASELTHEVKRSQIASSFGAASPDVQFAAGVMGAAEKLRGSAYSLSWSTDRITSLVCRADETEVDRKSFCELWKKSRVLAGEVTQQASSGE